MGRAVDRAKCGREVFVTYRTRWRCISHMTVGTVQGGWCRGGDLSKLYSPFRDGRTWPELTGPRVNHLSASAYFRLLSGQSLPRSLMDTALVNVGKVLLRYCRWPTDELNHQRRNLGSNNGESTQTISMAPPLQSKGLAPGSPVPPSSPAPPTPSGHPIAQVSRRIAL